MQQLALRDHQSAETMNELRALNARFIHNFVTNDVASHDAILHPRLHQHLAHGSALGSRDLSKILGNGLRSRGHRVLGRP